MENDSLKKFSKTKIHLFVFQKYMIDLQDCQGNRESLCLFWSKLYLEIGAYCLALSLLDALLPVQDDSSLLIFDPDPP